jgi:diaminopimelate epimerase
MKFTKMHGLGNDFIVIAGERKLPDNASELAVKLCDRHFGVGADGIVYILPSERADFMMRIINADGTEAEQCGNAVRCTAKYVYDHGLANSTSITIETIGAGVQPLTLTVEDGKVTRVRVDMGAPVLDGPSIPVLIEGGPIAGHPVSVQGREFRFTAVSMGNPHCVIRVDDAEAFDVGTWGPLLEHHPLFPRRTNVEFITVQDPRHIIMRVWERGVGPTLACGTGACATLVACVLNGYSERAATVSLAGGDLFIEWDEESGHVYMTGPAVEVFSGTLADI